MTGRQFAPNSKAWFFTMLAAFVMAGPWSGYGTAAETITSENVGLMAANAKTPQDYEALATYYDAQAKTAEKMAEQNKAQYEIFQKAKRHHTTETEAIVTQRSSMKQTSAYYLGLAAQASKLADLYRKLAQQTSSPADERREQKGRQ